MWSTKTNRLPKNALYNNELIINHVKSLTIGDRTFLNWNWKYYIRINMCVCGNVVVVLGFVGPSPIIALPCYDLSWLASLLRWDPNRMEYDAKSIQLQGVQFVWFTMKSHTIWNHRFFSLVVGIVLFNWTRQKRTRYDGCIFFHNLFSIYMNSN